jgi:hypothetical protein
MFIEEYGRNITLEASELSMFTVRFNDDVRSLNTGDIFKALEAVNKNFKNEWWRMVFFIGERRRTSLHVRIDMTGRVTIRRNKKTRGFDLFQDNQLLVKQSLQELVGERSMKFFKDFFPDGIW